MALKKTALKKAPVKKTAGAKVNKAKASAAKKPAVKKAYEVDNRVCFVGYVSAPEDPLFTPGEALHVIEVAETEDNKQVLTCIKEADYEAYQEDPESVNGEELTVEEVKRAKGKIIQPEAAPIEVKNVGEMAKIVKKGNLLETARLLFEEANQKFFYLGGTLAHIFHEGLYTTEEYGGHADPKTGWDEFCLSELGFKGRKGRYYMDIYMTFSQMPDFDVKKLNEMGWSKAAEISRYITEENVDELVNLANDTPIRDLREDLKENYSEGGVTASGREASRSAGKIKKIKLDVSLWEDQHQGVALIMDMAAKNLGLNTPGDVVEHIFTEWASEHLTDNQVKKANRAASSHLRELKKSGVDVQKAA